MLDSLFCNTDNIGLKVGSLTKLRISDSGWSSYYIDNSNKEEWLLTRYHSKQNGCGLPILKKLPQQSIQDLIEIAVFAKNIDDIRGAAIELYEIEKYEKKENWHSVIQKLQLIIPKKNPISKRTD